jgi:hypothetical protein
VVTKPVNPPVVKVRVKTHAALIQSVKQMRQQIDTLQENYRLKQQVSKILQQQVMPPLQSMQQAVQKLEQAPNDQHNVQQQSEELRSSCLYITQQLEDLLTLGKEDSLWVNLFDSDHSVCSNLHIGNYWHRPLYFGTRKQAVKNELRFCIIWGFEWLDVSVIVTGQRATLRDMFTY